ncbi:MAG: NYN domain-containing protein [Geodermatophilaceae bacterium]
MTDLPIPPPLNVVLPERVRVSVIRQAAEVLGRLGVDEVPAALRAAARFAPAKRAQLAAAALAATIEADAAFRARVAQAAEAAAGSLSDAVRDGGVPPAADPVQVGVLAFLLRPAGWVELIDRVGGQLAASVDQARSAEADRQLQRLQAQVDEARQERRAQTESARAELTEARSQLDGARRQLRDLTARARTAEEAAAAARSELEQLRRRTSREESTAQGEVRRLRQRVAAAEEAVEAVRRSGRAARDTDDSRLWLLLETLAGATQGLRRELAVTAPAQRPGDAVVGAQALGAPPPYTLRGDDPAVLDRLLSLPLVHMVIDGYNVTKSGYGEIPLETQRSRLVTGLGALAAQTGAEITCVFDGAERPPLMSPSPRGVRVLFSEAGQTADDLIRRFVAAEPAGRAVVVVSSDREVADGVRAGGAYPVASAALLRRLDRG